MAAIFKVRPSSCSNLNYLYSLLDSTNTLTLAKQFSTASRRTNFQTEYQQRRTNPNGPFRRSRNVGYNHNFGEFKQNPDGDLCEHKVSIDEMDSLCKEGKVKEAVEILDLLVKQGVDVDWPRYIQLMQVCGEYAAAQEAKAIHNGILRSKSCVDVSVQNKILEMYLKCGSISEAYELFERMSEQNMTSWDTMILGLTKNGLGEDAIDLFTQFKGTGLRPNDKMFLGVFSACSSLCHAEEGMLHFKSMSKVYGMIPSMNHYLGVVEILGRVGYLDEALEVIENMPFEPSVDVWEALMNLCRIHGNLELGERCAELVDHLDPSRLTEQSKAGLLLVSASDVVKEKTKKRNWTSAGPEFTAGDRSHPESDKIYALLRGLGAQMREAGYVPATRFLLHDIDEEAKEEALLSLSKLVAVAHGLLATFARYPIRIIKNFRFCGDDHNAMKIISKLTGRELSVRDAKRFHRFKDGQCSCGDYW